MTKTKIPYQETGYFSKLILDYLDENKELKPFYNHSCDIESFNVLIEERKQLPIDRSTLVDRLNHQYDNFELADEVKSNIQLLNNENCFTVTTGHQLNLFTGPLYFIYKIISTINLAKLLKEKYPENNFVPIYWMATEDHDFGEINHFNLFGKRYTLDKTQNGAVGRMKLEGMDELFATLKNDFGDRNNIDVIFDFFSKFYSSEKTYTQAIRGLVNHLFGKYGLVIIDADDAHLKSLIKEEFETELLKRKNYQLIDATSTKLKEIGFKPQLNPREINLFYLKKDLRERIVFENDKYKVLNTELHFSESEIIEELEKYPERFSPNAPMRCIYQEKILPNLAYIGGGGELAYWLQLKEMFNENGISFPILVLRNSVLFIDEGASKRISKLGLTLPELFKDSDHLIKAYLQNAVGDKLNLTQEKESVITVFEDILDKAKVVDNSLEPLAKGELQKIIKSLNYIENRLLKAEKKKQEVQVNQIINLKSKLFPKGSLQERHDNLISIFPSYGKEVIQELINNLYPLDNQFYIFFSIKK